MVFTRNIATDVKEYIMSLSGVKNIKQSEKYMGLPPVIGISKT